MSTTECTTCGQLWAVVPATLQAHPGQRITNGEKSDTWVQAGPSQILTLLPDTGGVVNVYEWACGDHTARWETTAYDTVPCTHGRTDGQPCVKYATNHEGLGLGYTLSGRTGGSYVQCPCCGHQGVHNVRRDGTNIPRCGATAATTRTPEVTP